MRWNFGGNLQPVRMICEYDWKECPIAVVSYVWSEIVTDVVDGITGDVQLWRILAVMLFCSMLFHTVYCKMKWVNKSENDYARERIIKVGFKVQDLELKINILTYKMQYGTWPLPCEISTSSLNDLRNVKLTLSNTSKQNMWTKHHSHRYASKCIKNSNGNKSMSNLLSMSEEMDLDHQKFLSQFKNRNNDVKMRKSERNLKLLHKEHNFGDYEKLIKTAKECKKYMNEINESNKSLGLLDYTSDISDRNSLKNISLGTESEETSQRFLIDSKKKLHQIYKYENRLDENLSETNLTTSNEIFSTSNLKQKQSTFFANDERYPLKDSKNRSRLLPPGLSITFLSDKFKTCESSSRCVATDSTSHINTNKNKASTNETLNKVKEKLESLHDIKHPMKNSKSLSNINGYREHKNSSEIALEIEKSSKINSMTNNIKYERKKQGDGKKLDKSISNPTPMRSFAGKLSARHSSSHNKCKSMPKMTNNGFSNIRKVKSRLDDNVCVDIGVNTKLNDVKTNVPNPWNVSIETTKNLITYPVKTCGIDESLSKITRKEEILSPESDSSTSFEVRSSFKRKKDLHSIKQISSINDANENVSKREGNISNNGKKKENNRNLNATNDKIESISKTSNTRYVSSPEDKSVYQMQMETDEDTAVFISRTSSTTELSKDSESDDKSTTTLLREALEFKKVLLMQINRENKIPEEKNSIIESSECESDDTSRSKTENHFQSKLLDIISEEQSAGSSTEKTSRTYILSRAINETNLREKPADKYLNENINAHGSKSSKFRVHDESRRDSKTIVAATSSEYFSINNVTDNENDNVQKINHLIADGNGITEFQKSHVNEMPEEELISNVIQNIKNNSISQTFDFELQQHHREENKYFIEPQQEKNANKIDKLKIKSIANLSSIDLEKEISWKSISESSNNESITQFDNTMANLKTEKNINIIAAQEFMSLNSANFEGRNFARAGEELQYSINSANKKQPSIISHLEINRSTECSDAFIKPLDMSECNLEKNENEEDASPLTGRTIVCNSKSHATNITRSLSKSEIDILKDKSSTEARINLTSKHNTNDAKDFQFNNEVSEGMKVSANGNLIIDKYEICGSNQNSEFSSNKNNLNKDAETAKNSNIIDKLQNRFAGTEIPLADFAKPVFDNIENEQDRVDETNNCVPSPGHSSSNTKCDTKLQSKSIANFSTDTSESYFDMSNHDFAVSSIILMPQNSNFVPNNRGNRVESDTSSLYVDASDYCSNKPSNSSSIEGSATLHISAKKHDFSKSQMENINTGETERIEIADAKIPVIKNMANENSIKHKSLTRTQLIPKCTASLPANNKQTESNAGVQSSSSLNQESTKGLSILNLEKSYIKHRIMSRSHIPILKSRIDSPKGEKSMEAKTRSRSPVHRSNTPTVQSTENNINAKEKRTMRQSTCGSKKSLNRKQSYTLPSTNNDANQECLRLKPNGQETEELLPTTENSNILGAAGPLAKECTVIYINIISDSDHNEIQNIDAKELIKYVNEMDLISQDINLDTKCQSLSLRNIKSDRTSDKKYEMNIVSPASDSELCKNVFNLVKNENTNVSIMEAVEKNSLISTTKTADKLLSTSTLEISTMPKVEQREIEVLAKPSVKSTSTSVSDFPDTLLKETRSFYNSKNEVFDISQDLVHKEQIVLSEMLSADPNLFECRKTHKLYNKLGLGFREQIEK